MHESDRPENPGKPKNPDVEAADPRGDVPHDLAARLQFALRLPTAGTWLGLSSLGALGALAFRWGDYNLNRDFARIMGKVALGIIGIELEIENLHRFENDQPCIYIANHQSGLDLYIFGSIFPSRTVVIGKHEVIWVPFFGLFFKGAGNILIVRNDRKNSLAGMKRAVEQVKKDRLSVWIFPEGTRNRSMTGLLPFKKGAFHMAIEAQVPLVPIVCQSLKPIFSPSTGHLRPGKVRMSVLEPIPTRGLTVDQLPELIDETHRKMSAEIARITAG